MKWAPLLLFKFDHSWRGNRRGRHDSQRMLQAVLADPSAIDQGARWSQPVCTLYVVITVKTVNSKNTANVMLRRRCDVLRRYDRTHARLYCKERCIENTILLYDFKLMSMETDVDRSVRKGNKLFIFRRRRPQELAEFLNGLMRNQNATKEKLPYHFSVWAYIFVSSPLLFLLVCHVRWTPVRALLFCCPFRFRI